MSVVTPPLLAAFDTRHGIQRTERTEPDRYGTPEVHVGLAASIELDGRVVDVTLEGAVDEDVADIRAPARYAATVTTIAAGRRPIAFDVWRGYALPPGDEVGRGAGALAVLLRGRVPSGDSAFDALYRVESRARRLTLGWLDSAARAALVAADAAPYSGAAMTVARGRVTVRSELDANDARGLDLLMRAAVAAAGVPTRQVERWRAAVGAAGAHLSGSWGPDSGGAMIWRADGVELRAEVAFAADTDGGGDEWLRTRVRAAWDGAPFALTHVDLGRKRRPRSSRRLRRVNGPWDGAPWRLAAVDVAQVPPLDHLREPLERAGVVSVMADGGVVTALVPGVEPPSWSALSELVAALSASARPAPGPYR